MSSSRTWLLCTEWPHFKAQATTNHSATCSVTRKNVWSGNCSAWIDQCLNIFISKICSVQTRKTKTHNSFSKTASYKVNPLSLQLSALGWSRRWCIFLHANMISSAHGLNASIFISVHWFVQNSVALLSLFCILTNHNRPLSQHD